LGRGNRAAKRCGVRGEERSVSHRYTPMYTDRARNRDRETGGPGDLGRQPCGHGPQGLGKHGLGLERQRPSPYPLPEGEGT
jgi:hypothetical protein